MLAPPVSNRRVVDFGAGVGRRSVYLYCLPEVESGHQVCGLLARALPLLTGRGGSAAARCVGCWCDPSSSSNESGHQVGPAGTSRLHLRPVRLPAVAVAALLPASAVAAALLLAATVAVAALPLPPQLPRAVGSPPRRAAGSPLGCPALTSTAAHTSSGCCPLAARQVFGVPSISARFGTDPEFWNMGMVLMARLAPRSEWQPPAVGASHQPPAVPGGGGSDTRLGCPPGEGTSLPPWSPQACGPAVSLQGRGFCGSSPAGPTALCGTAGPAALRAPGPPPTHPCML